MVMLKIRMCLIKGKGVVGIKQRPGVGAMFPHQRGEEQNHTHFGKTDELLQNSGGVFHPFLMDFIPCGEREETSSTCKEVVGMGTGCDETSLGATPGAAKTPPTAPFPPPGRDYLAGLWKTTL